SIISTYLILSYTTIHRIITYIISVSINTFTTTICVFNFIAIQFTIPLHYNRNSFYPLTLYHKTVSLLIKYEKFCNTVNRYSYKTVSLFPNMLYYLFYKFQSVHSQKNEIGRAHV